MKNIVTLKSEAGTARAIVKDATEHLQKWWIGGNFYEASMLEYIRRHYHGGTFIDCGSSIGNHTLFFAAFCADRVLSVEPVASSFVHQREVLALNGLGDKVTMVHTALSDYAGVGRMEHFAPENHNNVGMWRLDSTALGTPIDTAIRCAKLLEMPFAPPGDTDDIPVLPLDALANDLNLVDVKLVKIDVEYSELAVLRGAMHLLETYTPALFVEATDETHADVVALLEPLGYVQRARFNRSPTYEFIVPKPVQKKRIAVPVQPSVPAPAGHAGLVLLEYLGQNDGEETYFGATGTQYRFSASQRKRYVDAGDAGTLLAMRTRSGRRIFKRVKT
jgi:FkbM family methyltransferase